MILIGHRGARHESPENTLHSFNYLNQLGIQNVELDLHLSADNELVAIHDSTLDRTTDATGLVRETTSAALKQVNACVSFFSDAFPQGSINEGVPKLEEVLSIFNKLQHAQLEVKPPNINDHSIICERLAATLETLELQKSCFITSSDIDFLASCKKIIPHLKRGYIALDPAINALKTVKELQCDLLAIDWQLCSEALIKEAHQGNILVSAWTVNNKEAFDRLKSWGIDSIITDYPSHFIELV